MKPDLAQHALRIACRAYVIYCERHGKTIHDDDATIALLKQAVKDRLPEALQDAQDAIACGMNGIAVRTFEASMSLAGVDVGKQQ